MAAPAGHPAAVAVAPVLPSREPAACQPASCQPNTQGPVGRSTCDRRTRCAVSRTRPGRQGGRYRRRVRRRRRDLHRHRRHGHLPVPPEFRRGRRRARHRTAAPTGVTLTSSADNLTYHLAGASWFEGNFTAGGTSNFIDTEYFNILSPSGGVVARVAVTSVFVMNAQGVVTVDLLKDKGTCTAPEADSTPIGGAADQRSPGPVRGGTGVRYPKFTGSVSAFGLSVWGLPVLQRDGFKGPGGSPLEGRQPSLEGYRQSRHQP